METLNLQQFIPSGTKVLSGRNDGDKMRKQIKLDQKDEDEKCYEVVVPEKVFSLNPSFFLGCFGKSIRSLGEKGFKEKYIFKANEVIMANVNYGIERIKNAPNALQ